MGFTVFFFIMYVYVLLYIIYGIIEPGNTGGEPKSHTGSIFSFLAVGFPTSKLYLYKNISDRRIIFNHITAVTDIISSGFCIVLYEYIKAFL